MKPTINPHNIEALSPTETAELQIRTLYAAITEAHNARQFNRNQEPWYSAMTCSPNLQIEVAYGSRSHVSIDEYLETGKVLFGGNPNLFVEVTNLEIDVWVGDGRKRRGGMQEWSATVWAQQALRDGEVGLVRRSAVIAEYRMVIVIVGRTEGVGRAGGRDGGVLVLGILKEWMTGWVFEND